MKHKPITLILSVIAVTGTTQAKALQLPVCKSIPNCVSTQAQDAEHTVAPMALKAGVSPTAAWQAVRLAIISTERMLIVAESPYQLHAEATSRIFRFVDDVHVWLDVEHNTLHIYSASRLGYSDFGVNRARVEKIRHALQQAGIVA